MFIIQAVIGLMIDDLTRPEVQDEDAAQADSTMDDIEEEQDGNIRLTKEQENQAVRDSTAAFPDWVCAFFRQVFVVFEALPEPGKNNRNGGKMEDSMTQTLIVSVVF